MKRTAGPLDKRKRVTRCQACAKRRIKCEGGFPCEYCTRTKKECQPPKASPVGVTFVTVPEPPNKNRQVMVLPGQVPVQSEDLYFDQFVAFIQRSQFTRDFAVVGHDLLPLLNASQSLRDLAQAIGALDASRRASVKSSMELTSPQVVAFRSYGKAIQSFQTQLQSSDIMRTEGALWTTFLFGLFELMSDASSEQWAKHMQYGTARVLQLVGPTGLSSPLSLTLINAFCALEVNRAIIYGDTTFLMHDLWVKHQDRQLCQFSSPMQSVLELTLEVSSYSKQFFDQIESIPMPLRSQSEVVDTLASQGLYLRERLNNWKDQNASLDLTDPYSQLALSTHHALTLFLCQNFTYYSCWENRAIPQLSWEETHQRVALILELSKAVLDTSCIPGLLLLFSLRIAGIHSSQRERQDEALRVLEKIRTQGFVVADRIKVDLQEYWCYRDLTPEAQTIVYE